MASTGAQPLHHVRWSHSRLLWLVVGLVAAGGIVVGVDRLFFSGGGQTSRPDLQRTLDALVSGPQRSAPGASAYVVGRDGSWAGAAGVADVKTAEPMTADARMRIESNSKIWLSAVVLQLAKEGKLSLDDTVAHWLPGLLPYGDQITISDLMSDTSGLVDDYDGMFSSRSAFERALGNAKDPKLRAHWMMLARRLQRNPATRIDPIWLIRLAAWQPLVSAPGSVYHHSNPGWNIVGLIAAKAGGKPLAALYQKRIVEPLGLTHSAYQPQGPIAGAHVTSYSVVANGGLTEHAYPFGMGAAGGVVTDAADEAAFIQAFVGGKLGVRRQLLDFYRARGSNGPGCPGDAFLWVGANGGGWSYVYSDHTGKHVAVLLLNGARLTTVDTGDPKVAAAARHLYCGT
jgi:D-alanyl-D-alanine carboxypeptidase